MSAGGTNLSEKHTQALCKIRTGPARFIGGSWSSRWGWLLFEKQGRVSLIPRPCMPSVSLLCAPPLDGAFQLHQFITVTESSYAYLILRVIHAGEKQDIVYISLFKDGKQKVSKLLAQGCTTNLSFLFQLHIRSLPLVLYNYYKEWTELNQPCIVHIMVFFNDYQDNEIIPRFFYDTVKLGHLLRGY